MGLREKHQRAKQEKKALKKEIETIRDKISKQQRKLAQKESKVESINIKIKQFKKKLRERRTEEKNKEKKKKKTQVQKDQSLIPETEKHLRTVPVTEKSLSAMPDRSLRKTDEKENKPSKAIEGKDKLTLIEGIGSKTEQVLNEKGITTFLQLSNCSSAVLDVIIRENFPNFRVFETLTWPEQALLAYNGQWDELKILQDKLTGGKKA
jgi:large subunit ribosomal protein L21